MADKYRKMVLEGCKLITENGLVKGTWGNVSVLDDNNNIYITPSAFPYDKLKEEDIVVVDMRGDVIEGHNIPSSELRVHLEIYKSRSDVKAIVHTHPVYSTIASVCVDSIPPIVEDGVMICGEKIIVADFASAGSQELAENVVKALGKNNAAIMRNHGLVTAGETINEAVTASIVCEKTVQIYLEALKIGNIHVLSDEEASKLREKYLKFYKQD